MTKFSPRMVLLDSQAMVLQGRGITSSIRLEDIGTSVGIAGPGVVRQKMSSGLNTSHLAVSGSIFEGNTPLIIVAYQSAVLLTTSTSSYSREEASAGTGSGLGVILTFIW